MSLKQGIAHHKEYRHPYYKKAERIDPSCRNHGDDVISKEDRLIQSIKANPAFDPADPIELDYRKKEKDKVSKESDGGYGVSHIAK